jgi:hypothetical protein
MAGVILGGYKLKLRRHEILFDYVSSSCNVGVLKTALASATEINPQDVEIGFRYSSRNQQYFCRIFRNIDCYLIGGWQLPKNLIYFPGRSNAINNGSMEN